MPEQDDGVMPLTSHLSELRRRLIICCVSIAVGFLISYTFSEDIFKFLARPLLLALPPGTTSLVFIGVLEPFFTYLKVSVLTGIILTSPILIYQIWAFIAPGLYKGERKWFWSIVAFSTIFFLFGIFFAYMAVFPLGFKYLLSFANEELRPTLSIAMYFSMATKLIVAFGVVFELPLFMFFLARFGIVNARKFSHYRRYAIVLAVIFAAALTPPDIFSQLMMAVPIILLYEIGIIVAKIFGKKERNEEDT
jgi:sec-independent protein translocase protein TatC